MANRGAHDTALSRRGALLVWFDPEAEGLAAPRGHRGRPATDSDAAIRTCPMLKALFGPALRHTTGLVASLPTLAKPDWPSWTGRCRTSARCAGVGAGWPSRSPAARARERCTSRSCSTGIKAAGEGEWSTRKHGACRPRPRRKVHPGIDAETMEARTVEGAPGPIEPALMERAPPTTSREGQDAMLQAPGRAPSGPHLRPSDHRDPRSSRPAQPLHPPWCPQDAARFITPTRVRRASTSDRVLQQSRKDADSALGQLMRACSHAQPLTGPSRPPTWPGRAWSWRRR